MSMPAVEIRNLAKKYRLYDKPHHRLLEALDPWRRSYHRDFWALRDINLTVEAGQTVGLLGMNGSGKSTLLQIVSSVLQPTEGELKINGKVAALLELGAGFNADFTGRENVMMNGALMGLSRRQMESRMRDIQVFADIGEFFEQPMRTYSSGMYARVAFATAVHVDADILVIDEALSVGDARFVDKCFRRIREFRRSGKTILYVTHNRQQVPEICDVAALLHKGQLVKTGAPREIVELYSRILSTGKPDQPEERPLPSVNGHAKLNGRTARKGLLNANGENPDEDVADLRASYNCSEFRYGSGAAKIVDYAITSDGINEAGIIQTGQPLEIQFRVHYFVDVLRPIVGLTVRTKEGVLVFSTNSDWLSMPSLPRKAGEYGDYSFRLVANLPAGDCFCELAVASDDREMLDVRESLIHLQVLAPERFVGLAYLPATCVNLV
ncbi:MAG: ABC transporter ATP-binding protein [Hyphomicrobium sp.]|uniref:ABC transporter ATP-binding protein n=1 Tax=Hyphomicrobium sp. TaxID=82 RepID=UPI001320818A|nr:ABC transporter ATP-binding protein [Hyphomicrobium sp.]KAB2939013.1 MAG: ABC transporter ATP-binding protein [Hyphomicrobium sp.]MBZ0211758.1 ABC transporter ATP-binding protein [Hyphomicrobium sp.]